MHTFSKLIKAYRTISSRHFSVQYAVKRLSSTQWATTCTLDEKNESEIFRDLNSVRRALANGESHAKNLVCSKIKDRRKNQVTKSGYFELS